jgi:hypothetical protein
MAEKEPVRKREYLPPLKHTTVSTLMQQGPDAIRMLAASNGHKSIAMDSSVSEDSPSVAARGAAARDEIRGSLPDELKAIRKGRTYWHKKRQVYVTVVECAIGQSEAGDTLHKAIDGDGNELNVAERFLKTVQY